MSGTNEQILQDCVERLQLRVVELEAIERRYKALVENGWRIVKNRHQTWVFADFTNNVGEGATPEEAIDAAIERKEKS